MAPEFCHGGYKSMELQVLFLARYGRTVGPGILAMGLQSLAGLSLPAASA